MDLSDHIADYSHNWILKWNSRNLGFFGGMYMSQTFL